jgi:hypothetical protein
MPAISNIRLTDAIVQVGATLTRLQGFGDDMFTLAPATDVGAMLTGVLGDVMFVQRVQNGWVMTITFFTASTGITLLNTLHSTVGVFPIAVTYGAFNLVGFAAMQNPGEVAAGLSANTRSIVLNVAKTAGDTDAAPGNVLQVL